jgi:hypothetical protein
MIKQYEEEPIQREVQGKQTYDFHTLALSWLMPSSNHASQAGNYIGQSESCVTSDPDDGDRDCP